jgi:hypothetical protein
MLSCFSPENIHNQAIKPSNKSKWPIGGGTNGELNQHECSWDNDDERVENKLQCWQSLIGKLFEVVPQCSSVVKAFTSLVGTNLGGHTHAQHTEWAEEHMDHVSLKERECYSSQLNILLSFGLYILVG